VNVTIAQRLPGELMDGNDMGARDSAVFDWSAFTAQSVQVSVIFNVANSAWSFRTLYQIAVIILRLLDLAFTGTLQIAYDFVGQLGLETNAEFCVNPFAMMCRALPFATSSP
jgi:fatty-acid desaturase